MCFKKEHSDLRIQQCITQICFKGETIMTNKRFYHKLLSVLLCLALTVSYIPATVITAADLGSGLDIVEDSKISDPSTLGGWTRYFGPNKMDTEFAGAVWTDKSVFTEATNELPGVSLTDSNNFLVALSAIASNLSITGHTSSPTDTMLVLDLSGSMVDGTTTVGYVRQGNNNYRQVTAIDMSLINAMIEATNATIHKLMTQNTNNRVGVVLYSGNTSSSQDATPGTATVVLPLGRYTGVSGEYLSVDADTTTSQLYTRQGNRWVSAGTSDPYVPTGEDVNVSVKNGLKTEAGGNVTDSSKQVVGGTYIQNGLYKAMDQFLDVNDTTVPAGRPQEGAERLPVIVLMTDGAPTIATTNYRNIGDSNTGNGTATNDRITFLTQLTAAYVRGNVAAHYQENENDDKDALFLTLGLGTENSSAATNTLYPAGSNRTLTDYWNRYMRGTAGNSVSIISGAGGLSVTRDSAVAGMNYVDKYFYASNAEGLLDSFNDILSEISLKAESYTTLVEGGNADFSGYVTFDDELGEMMQVDKVSGILLGNTLFTGIEIAKGMTDGNLGTVQGPTEKGDELVRTVKERIPGTTTTQAQQLINNAYLDQQLYYDEATGAWSNYIGWYADADGNYVGFWDKDSGYENAPADAVYANRSYGYLGENKSSDMMHTVVMVRTELKTLHQSVFFKIPAALLPTVQYKITLAENDPSQVEAFTREAALPIRLVFEVGVRDDINSVNLLQKLPANYARNADGTVTLFTNEFKIGNDENENGIPDPEEVDDAVVTQAHFHPALDNSRFYYTEDTVILTGNGSEVTSATRPTDTDSDASNGTGYYYNRYIYSSSGRSTIQTPIAATTLANDAAYADGRWYIPAGTMYHNLARFKTPKVDPQTASLDYSFFPAVFDQVSKQDVYMFLGNNGSLQVAPATGFVLNKQVQGTIAGVTQYTFRVTLSDTSATPVLTDANGNALSGVTMSAVTGGQFTVTMPAGVEAYISGIPANTRVTVEEQINGDYKVVGVKVAGADQTGSASFTVPAYAENGPSQMVPVTFTNAPNGYGDLVITKDVHHELASDPAALATKVFTFSVKLTGDKINTSGKFATSTGKDVVVAADGTVTFEDGTPIQLRNEESITIYRLPEGTAYTVEETNIPEGFELTSKVSDTGTIAANRADTAAFVNSYPDQFIPVEIPLDVTVNKILSDPGNTYSGNEEFVFVLQRLLSDNTYPSIADDNNNAYLKVSANSNNTGTWTPKFSDLGTYYYRVVELKPSEQTPAGTDTPGMTYSTTRALFAVIVTDDDMDGKLEIAIREEAHVDASATYTDPDNKETVTGLSVSAEFTNTYELHSTSVSVPVHKDLVNTTGVDIPLTSFQFGLYAVDGDGNATGDPIRTVTASQLGDATFNLPITVNQDLTYIIKEIVPATQNPGMTYSSAEYVLTIDVEADIEGQLSASSMLTLKGGDGSPLSQAAFENTYKLHPVSIQIPIAKTFTGRALKDGESFQAYLVRTSDTFSILTGNDAWNATYTLPVNSSGNVALNFTKAGTYHYKFTEVIPEGGNTKGMTYDTSEYHITVTVTDNGQGALAAQTVIHKLGEAAPVTTVAFTNTYTVTGEGSTTIGGKKDLSGRALAAGEFEIGLYRDANCTDLIETTTNRADGTFSFSPIPYTTADLGEGNAPKTYTYYVKEINDGKGGVTYDANVYTVTVTVSHENGILTVTPSQNAANLQINNSYAAKEVTATIRGEKILSGNWDAVRNKDFTFQLFAADQAFAITDQTPLATKTVTGNDTFSFSRTYNDGDEDTYYYVLKENIPQTDSEEDEYGIGYDAGEYHITVNVSDPGNGQLVATVTMYRPGTGNTASAVFTNGYTAKPATLTLEGSKSFINTATGLPMTMAEGDFSFLVLEGDDLVTTGYNKADGTIYFPEITYTAPGIHTYTVVEEVGEAGGVSYDEDARFEVVVTVTDNGEGKLIATADYKGTPIAFENKYTPESAQVVLGGVKTLENQTLTADKFTFWLYETDSTFATQGVTPAAKGHAANGTMDLGTLTFGKAGTYYYRLVEKNGGETLSGIAYSSAAYNITVVVTDNGSGKLIPAVTVAGGNPSVTVTENVATVTGLDFTNTYTPKPVTYTPKAEKSYKGDEMKTFDFVLSGEGFAQQTKQNGTDGKVTFDTLTFDQAGTYELTVREQKNALWGFIRWDVNVYKLTVKVVDDGAGQLHIDSVTVTSTLGTDDLVFRNVHEDLITHKDVFLYSAPTVSIDGKKVQIGDELLYKISYTNYTGKAATKVTVTDTLPASLAYVEGSADKGGSFANGVVTWQLTNVAAGETVTVSFRAKVANTTAAVANTATVVDDENTYTTNEVTNPVTNDEVVKTVAKADAPTVSIDGQKVAVGDVLLYTITYKNGDDQAAKVTVTDTLSQYIAYVEGSADNAGVYANGALAWTLELAAGESKTVTFKATVKAAGATIQNQAQTYDGVNKLVSNTVSTYTPAPPATPQTGDEMNLVLWLGLLLISAAGMAVLLTNRKRIFR